MEMWILFCDSAQALVAVKHVVSYIAAAPLWKTCHISNAFVSRGAGYRGLSREGDQALRCEHSAGREPSFLWASCDTGRR